MATARIALGLEYDGSDFFGWQSQPGGNTVQDALETALAAVAQQPIRVHCAGRTDTGVHASGQVVHFDVDVARPLTAWVRGVNAHLPPAIAVLWAKPTSAAFHARFSAQSRRYRYLLLNRPTRPGLLARRVGWYHRPLDCSQMADAGRLLLGTHDFSSFRSSACQAKSPIKTLHQLTVTRMGDLVTFALEADGFLHHMVRNLVGALLTVGNGSCSATDIEALLAARNRKLAPPTFAPDGLYFDGPTYDAAIDIPNYSRGDTALNHADAIASLSSAQMADVDRAGARRT